MISFKKSYAEQMLQLALALSLLQVDPRDYFSQGWDSQLDMRNGDGWQLEMLRAVPISEYPYANRKAMMPLIEDLVRFDRQNIQDITTYLLNVQNAQSNHTNIQDHENSMGSGGGGSGGSINGAVAIEQAPNIDTSNSNLNEIDVFLNSNHIEEEISIIDQNLADLGEYGDVPLSVFPYFGLPLKDEPPEEVSLPNIIIKQEIPSTSSGFDTCTKIPSTSTNIKSENFNWNNLENFTLENLNEDELKNDDDNTKVEKEIKKENDDEETTNEPILSIAELTKEVILNIFL